MSGHSLENAIGHVTLKKKKKIVKGLHVCKAGVSNIQPMVEELLKNNLAHEVCLNKIHPVGCKGI